MKVSRIQGTWVVRLLSQGVGDVRYLTLVLVGARSWGLHKTLRKHVVLLYLLTLQINRTRQANLRPLDFLLLKNLGNLVGVWRGSLAANLREVVLRSVAEARRPFVFLIRQIVKLVETKKRKTSRWLSLQSAELWKT